MLYASIQAGLHELSKGHMLADVVAIIGKEWIIWLQTVEKILSTGFYESNVIHKWFFKAFLIHKSSAFDIDNYLNA
jgi:hypothetical protein